MGKGKKSGTGKSDRPVNRPAVDNDQLGENAYEKYAPEGKKDKKGK